MCVSCVCERVAREYGSTGDGRGQSRQLKTRTPHKDVRKNYWAIHFTESILTDHGEIVSSLV